MTRDEREGTKVKSASGLRETLRDKIVFISTLSAGFGACSFFQVMRKISPTPVQMAVSATLKAGKPISPPPRCCM